MTKPDNLKADERFYVTEYSSKRGKLLDGTECRLHLDTMANKSFMLKTYFKKQILSLITILYL